MGGLGSAVGLSNRDSRSRSVRSVSGVAMRAVVLNRGVFGCVMVNDVSGIVRDRLGGGGVVVGCVVVDNDGMRSVVVDRLGRVLVAMRRRDVFMGTVHRSLVHRASQSGGSEEGDGDDVE